MKIDLNNNPQAKNLLYMGGAILALFVLYKLAKTIGDTVQSVGEGLGVSDTKEEKKVVKETEKALKDFQKEANKYSKPTRTSAQWALVANNIYNALKSSSAADNKTAAYTELARVLTDADMGALLVAFGRRQEYGFGFPIGDPQTLPEFVNGNFSSDDIADLNKLYAKSKMRFKF